MTVKKSVHPFYERLSLVLIGLIALGYLVILGKELLDPLIFGFLFAILLLPVAGFLEKKLRFPRAISSLVSQHNSKNNRIRFRCIRINIRGNIIPDAFLCVYSHFHLLYTALQAFADAFYCMGFQ